MTGSDTLTLDALSGMVKPLMEKHGIEKAVVFGSYARGTASPHSDIDLVVYGGESFRGRSVFALAEELHEASGKRIDVFERSEILEDSPLLRSIEEDGVVL